MKTFQNRGEGFDVGEALGSYSLVIRDAADGATELVNRCHMRCDVVDDEIVDFFRSKMFGSTGAVYVRERQKELDDRIRGFSVDDQIFLGDENISNLFGEVFFDSWKRIDGGFELRRSGGVRKRRDQRIHDLKKN